MRTFCRIGYQFATAGLAITARKASIYKEQKFSDHVPLKRLSGQRASLTDFMQASPLVGLEDELSFERSDSLTRDARF